MPCPRVASQILTVMALLVRVIGAPAAFAGLGFTVAVIPLITYVGSVLAQLRKQTMALTDARVKLCTEILTGEGMGARGCVCVGCLMRLRQGGVERPWVVSGAGQATAVATRGPSHVARSWRRHVRVPQSASRHAAAPAPLNPPPAQLQPFPTHTHTRTHMHIGIKAIKLYAWEEPYRERITDLREQVR